MNTDGQCERDHRKLPVLQPLYSVTYETNLSGTNCGGAEQLTDEDLIRCEETLAQLIRREMSMQNSKQRALMIIGRVLLVLVIVALVFLFIYLCLPTVRSQSLWYPPNPISKERSIITDDPIYNNLEVQCPLPENLHIRNKGGVDGAGLCVFASITHSAHWQHEQRLYDLFNYMRTQPGGGHPQKVSRYLKKFGLVEGTDFFQVTSMSEVLPAIEYALNTGRMAAITWGFDRRGTPIAHMVSLVKFGEMCCVIDNNYPGTWEWVSYEELKRRLRGSWGDNNAWAVILLAPPPPPVPSSILLPEPK
jgi:hypothetical protein